ncbi:uncharacterized protein EDB91DRAFT_1063714 [Suillus paluster]|uniref:uncharacterized protein n=1 Tax=Suillus paluster TaxID=48578 RepID=UPI001B85E92D|nr:uncharacterized protein EDB91DRAFT_1063714 [Suillus paluster]KAG1722885.1 hypothetical protein EDB91DRAFT_1063714 [Suillus paluster]
MLSLCNHYRELRVHIYDHSGSAVSPPFHISQQKKKFLQILSAIVFGNGECIGFDTTMNIRQLKLPVLSRLNDNWYDILEVLFSSHGLVGRGTVCYLARKDDEEYIIKDHWVLGNADDEDILNEVAMLKKMQGVRGVPELVEFSKVKLLTGEVDNTKIYRYQELPSLVGTWRTHFRLIMKPRG